MPDLFTSLVAISPLVTQTLGTQSERVPGVTPLMKNGIIGERASAITGTYTPPVVCSLNAFVIL